LDRATAAEKGWSWTERFETSDRAGEYVFAISADRPMKVSFSLEFEASERRP